MAIQFDVQLPPPVDADVVGGRLTVTKTLKGSLSTETIDTAKDQTLVTELLGDQETEVSLSFVFVDDAGNVSVTPSTLTAVLTDTIPPSDPGALAIIATAEVDDPVDPTDPEEPTDTE